MARTRPPRKGLPLAAFLLLLFVLTATTAQAAPYIRTLSVPGLPLTVLLDERDGLIRSAYLRSPSGTDELPSLKGHRLVRENRSRPYVDSDWRADLLWQLSFAEADGKRGIDLWIAHLTRRPRLWVAESPTGATLWDSLSINLDLPPGSALYVSATLPPYDENKPAREGRTLSFVYTIGLTPDGPSFIIVPSVYHRLQEMTLLLAQAEGDEVLRGRYDSLAKDFGAMAKGQHPSAEALSSFGWRRLLYREWP